MKVLLILCKSTMLSMSILGGVVIGTEKEMCARFVGLFFLILGTFAYTAMGEIK